MLDYKPLFGSNQEKVWLAMEVGRQYYAHEILKLVDMPNYRIHATIGGMPLFREDCPRTGLKLYTRRHV